jgi:hypothetical protein
MKIPVIGKVDEDGKLEIASKLNDLHHKYIKGKSWQCDDRSPTGAHYWIETKKGHESSDFTCQYCGEIRKMCNTFSGQMAIVAKKMKKAKVLGYTS